VPVPNRWYEPVRGLDPSQTRVSVPGDLGAVPGSYDTRVAAERLSGARDHDGEAPTDELLAEIEKIGTVLHESESDGGIHVVTQSCLCSLEGTVIERFEEHNCLYQPPTIHQQGWEHYTVVAFDDADIRELLQDLRSDGRLSCSRRPQSRRRRSHSMLAPVNRLFEDITDRQLAALQLALERGYYEQPRGRRSPRTGDLTSVARPTYEEHLRKAENKLLTNEPATGHRDVDCGYRWTSGDRGEVQRRGGIDRSPTGSPEQHADRVTAHRTRTRSHDGSVRLRLRREGSSTNRPCSRLRPGAPGRTPPNVPYLRPDCDGCRPSLAAWSTQKDETWPTRSG